MVYYMVLPFVVALIRNEKGEVLIGQMTNSRTKPYPGFWDLPGGKLEEGESAEDCIKREVMEELGLRTISLKFRGVFHHNGKNVLKSCTNHIPGLGLCYEAKVIGKIVPTEQENVHYTKLSELKKMKMTPWTKYFLKDFLK
jgi:8-oxo-dGTP diphosphatase